MISALQYLIALCGVPLWVAGALLPLRCAYATVPFLAGLSLHLIGLALCLIALSAPGLIISVQHRKTLYSTKQSLKRGEPRLARYDLLAQVTRFALNLILLIALLVTAVVVEHRLSKLVALQQMGRKTEAWIISKERESKLGTADSGLVYYSFRVQSITVTGRFRAARADYPALRTGRRFSVTYLPSDPRVYLIGTVDATTVRQHGEAILLLAVIALTYLALPICMVRNRLGKQLRLARRGTVMTGTITGCRPVDRGGSRAGYRVRYEFSLPTGESFKGRTFVRHKAGEPTLVGFPIAVLYDPFRPYDHAPQSALTRVKFHTALERALTA